MTKVTEKPEFNSIYDRVDDAAMSRLTFALSCIAMGDDITDDETYLKSEIMRLTDLVTRMELRMSTARPFKSASSFYRRQIVVVQQFIDAHKTELTARTKHNDN